MQIKYILIQIQKHKGFVYGQARLMKKRSQIILEIDIHHGGLQGSGQALMISGTRFGQILEAGRPGPTIPGIQFSAVPFAGVAVRIGC